MRVQSIKCDNCQKELITNSKYPHNYNFQLSVIDTNINTSGTQYAVHMSPPFHRDKHFCSNKCIIEHLGGEVKDNKDINIDTLKLDALYTNSKVTLT